MTSVFTRRRVATAAVCVAACRGLPARGQAPAATRLLASDAMSARARDALAALESRNGGRLGVAALDIGSGRRIGYRAEERFAMCSTHKFLTAAAILTLVDQRQMNLDRRVPYGRTDLLEYAPITRKNVDTGFMTVDALCAAAIEWSDNTAANLLLRLIGGPPGWTRYAHSIGDATSRLDRIEPALNTAIPGDPRDTTTPDAMVHDLNLMLVGKILSDASRTRLENWMFDSRITSNLLRAGLPNGWRVGDKSGSGEHGTRNDIGIIVPPGAAPIVAAVYYTASVEPLSSREQVIAETGRIIAQSLGT
jgi:beta-lactamase class A